MRNVISEMMEAYYEWKTVRPKLSGSAKRRFDRWLAETKPEIFAQYAGRVAEFSLQCEEVRRLCDGPKPKKGLSSAMLQKYGTELIRIYRALPATDRPAFQAFLASVQETCLTEWMLAQFIKTHLPVESQSAA